jgi:hypothetical protein
VLLLNSSAMVRAQRTMKSVIRAEILNENIGKIPDKRKEKIGSAIRALTFLNLFAAKPDQEHARRLKHV